MSNDFVGDNESKSSSWCHSRSPFSETSFAQSKLVRVIKGAVLDVLWISGKGSPNIWKHVSVELTEDNHRQFFIPRGFAHGFTVLSEEVIFQYKCDNFYHPEAEGRLPGMIQNLNIDWKIPQDRVILSGKDYTHPLLHNIELQFDINNTLYE